MVVGTMIIEFHLHENCSLKGKRKIVNKFNVAIAEIGSNDKWQKIELGVSTVANDRRHVDSSLANVLSFLDSLYLAEIIDSKIEIMNI